jgi:hypothetical protein
LLREIFVDPIGYPGLLQMGQAARATFFGTLVERPLYRFGAEDQHGKPLRHER